MVLYNRFKTYSTNLNARDVYGMTPRDRSISSLQPLLLASISFFQDWIWHQYHHRQLTFFSSTFPFCRSRRWHIIWLGESPRKFLPKWGSPIFASCIITFHIPISSSKIGKNCYIHFSEVNQLLYRQIHSFKKFFVTLQIWQRLSLSKPGSFRKTNLICKSLSLLNFCHAKSCKSWKVSKKNH